MSWHDVVAAAGLKGIETASGGVKGNETASEGRCFVTHKKRRGLLGSAIME